MGVGLSLKKALSWVKEWRTRCVSESDANLLIDAFHGSRGSSFFDTIVEECIELSKHFEKVLFIFSHQSVRIE